MVIQEFCPDGTGGLEVDPVSLPLLDATVEGLWDWHRAFSSMNFSDTDQPLDIDVKLLDERGVAIWQAVRAELDGQFQVYYHSLRFNETFRVPEDLIELQKAPL